MKICTLLWVQFGAEAKDTKNKRESKDIS